MADEEKKTNVVGEALLILGGLAALVIVWFMSGGPGRADLRGLFLAPPPPLGTGEAYGPQLGSSTTPAATTTTQYENTNQYGPIN